MNAYFVIRPGVPVPLYNSWSSHYELIRDLAAKRGGVVTGYSWLAAKGTDIRKEVRTRGRDPETNEEAVPERPITKFFRGEAKLQELLPIKGGSAH